MLLQWLVKLQKILHVRRETQCDRLKYQWIGQEYYLLMTQYLNFWSQQILDYLSMKRYFNRLIAISVLNMLFAAISNANIGIISQFASQHENHWIGPLSIALIFLGSGIGALYNKYLQKYPYNRVIFAGATGWDFFNAFSVMFLFIGFQNFINAIIIAGSLLCGFTVSLFYNGIFNYINQCGKRDKRSKMYFGINMCFNQSSNIVGNATSALLIEPLGQKTYSFVMLAAGIVLSLCYLPFKGFDQPPTKNQDLSVEASLIVPDDSPCTDVQVPGGTKQFENQVPRQTAPLLLFFIFALSGVMISFVYGQFSILFYKYYNDMSKQQLNKLTFTAFMIEGCGELIGGLLLALFSQKIKNIPLAYALNGLLFAASLLLINFGFENDNIAVINGGAFFVGVADCFCFAIALAIGGHWSESGLSLFNLGQSGTVAIISVLHIFIDLAYLSIIYSLVFLLTILTLIMFRRQISGIHIQHK